ncbi:hypothetical protein ACOQFO_01895 [Ureibacillus sp. MALMAid1270]|uniref:hypothetical protein n=1 Tax=Ureibacillus sp. MALMAid1270 TaxID=3411629 RepID=UPI003BA6A3DB
MTETDLLIMQAKNGNLRAFEQLISEYIPIIERFSFQCGVPFDQIEDVYFNNPTNQKESSSF